jgi:hypothetical protein
MLLTEPFCNKVIYWFFFNFDDTLQDKKQIFYLFLILTTFYQKMSLQDCKKKNCHIIHTSEIALKVIK